MSNDEIGLTQTDLASVQLVGDSNSDDAEVSNACKSLVAEIMDFPGIENPRKLASGTSPGSKAGELLTIGALVLAIAPHAVPKLIEFLKDWLLRPNNNIVKIKVAVDGKEVQVEYDIFKNSDRKITTAVRNIVKTVTKL